MINLKPIISAALQEGGSDRVSFAEDFGKSSFFLAGSSGKPTPVFDPVDWLSPFVLRGKLFVQRMCAQEIQWDDAVDEELRELLETWCREAEDLRDVSIKRTHNQGDCRVLSRKLHILGDASERAYSAVAYIQCLYEDDTSSVSLVMAKIKLAPLKKQTLPRLELLAALVAVRLRSTLVDQLGVPIDEVVLYTDWQITHCWCPTENPGKWKTFVANRV